MLVCSSPLVFPVAIFHRRSSLCFLFWVSAPVSGFPCSRSSLDLQFSVSGAAATSQEQLVFVLRRLLERFRIRSPVFFCHPDSVLSHRWSCLRSPRSTGIFPNEISFALRITPARFASSRVVPRRCSPRFSCCRSDPVLAFFLGQAQGSWRPKVLRFALLGLQLGLFFAFRPPPVWSSVFSVGLILIRCKASSFLARDLCRCRSSVRPPSRFSQFVGMTH
jgi:hypothetical protein